MSNEKAKQMLEEVLKYIPRGTQTMSKCYKNWILNDEFPIFVESQKGCEITSVDGNIFLDLMGGLGPNFLPHEVIQKAVAEQLKKGACFSLPTLLELEVAKLINEIAPWNEQIKFCKNGSDATTGAIRCARSFKKRDYILMSEFGYHGWQDFACMQRDFGIPSEYKKYIHTFKYNDVGDLEGKIKTMKYAAVIMEPVALEMPKNNFLQKVRELCDKYDTILIFDELVTGFRLAPGGGAEFFNVRPDMCCYGKALCTGLPLAAIGGKRDIMLEFENIFFSATYFGETLSLAAAKATLEYIKKNKSKIYSTTFKKGKLIQKTFNKVCKKLGIDGNTVGMPQRFNVKFHYDNELAIRDLWHKEMIHRGCFAGIQIYITPRHKPQHIKKIIQAMTESLEVVAKAIKENKVDEALGGLHSSPVFKRGS